MSIFKSFEEIAKQFLGNEAVAILRDGRYQTTSYGELRSHVMAFSNALLLQLTKRDKMAILLENSPEWIIADLAAARAGIIVVPIHATYTSHYVEQILKHAGASLLLISADKLDKHERVIRGAGVKTIVVVGTPLRQDIISYSDFISSHAGDREVDDVSPDSIHTIMYTSGTTGDPKGVMLTHNNLLGNAFAAKEKITVYPNDRFFSFLPLSHIFERTAGYYVPITTGAAIYFARSPKTLVEDIKLAKPTILVSVPRIFERVHEKIEEKIEKSVLKKKLFAAAFSLVRESEKRSLTALEKIRMAIYQRLLFSKIHAVFGSRLRFAVSGGASLARHIAEFFYSVGIRVVEGYGLTETSPILTVNSIDNLKFGTVGKPVRDVMVRIADDGEILAKTPGLMQGYFNNEDAYQTVVDGNGWFHTGDIGSIDVDGFLTILGRKKEMIVLSTGKNVFPVPIEQALEESKFIKQAMVYGDGQKTLHAIIVPELEHIKTQFPEWNLNTENQEVNTFFRKEIKLMLTNFQHFEQVSDFTLRTEEFTIENGMLTPTMKLVRNKIASDFNG